MTVHHSQYFIQQCTKTYLYFLHIFFPFIQFGCQFVYLLFVDMLFHVAD